MSYYTKVICLVWFIIISHFTATKTQAQDLRFTQWHASDMMLNPAFAGAGRGGRISANFRSQWPDMPQTFLSYRIAYDQPIGDLNSGFGIYMMKDDLGDQVLNNLNLGFQFMYQAKVSTTAAFNFGLQLGMAQRKLNWSKLQFYDQIHPVYGFNNASGLPNSTNEPLPPSLSFSVLDIGLGAAFVTEKGYFGASFMHVNNPPNSFYDNAEERLPGAVSLQTGIFLKEKHRKRDPFMAEPSLLFFTQGGNSQLQIGSSFAKSLVITGIYLKNNMAGMSDVSLMAGFRKDWLLFTYSYDLTLGGLAGETGGAHEVGLIFRLDDAGKNAKGKHYNVLPRPTVF